MQRITSSAPVGRSRARTPHPGWLRAIDLSTLFAFSACSATLTRRDGASYDGTIIGSDAEAVRIRTNSGSVQEVPREDIADLDHPGNVVGTIALAGAVLYGAILGAALAEDPGRPGSPQRGGRDGNIGIGAGGLGACLFLAIVNWGFYYYPSRKAANNFGPARVVPIGRSPSLPKNPPPPFSPATSRKPPALDASPASGIVPQDP